MNIIISGCVPSHFLGHTVFTRCPTVGQHLFDGLKFAGHNPEMVHPSKLQDRILNNCPDLIIFGLSPAVNMTARYIFYEWEAIELCINLGIKWCWYIDDWRFSILKRDAISMLSYFEHRVIIGKNYRAGDMAWRLSLEKAASIILTDFLNGRSAPIIMVVFDPGVPEPLIHSHMCGNRIIQVDPSSVYPTNEVHDFTIDSKREYRWVLAAMNNYQKWLWKLGKIKWLIKFFGPTGGVREHIHEDIILNDWYAKSWGMLVPSYPINLGRLWRSRYVHGYLTRSITLTTDIEIISTFGDSYNINIGTVESRSFRQLVTLRDCQSNDFEAATEDKFQYAARLNDGVMSI